MEQLTNHKFYQLGRGEDLVFQKDLEALSVDLNRPFPEFFGGQVNDQPGGELQWVVMADLRGSMEPPTSERIQFTVRENNWMDGLARAMQEALARLCGQNVNRIKATRFFHYARHDSMGEPMDMPPHPELKYHVEHLDFMLHETRKELDNSRAHVSQMYIDHAKKDCIIARLRSRIASLELEKEAEETTIPE